MLLLIELDTRGYREERLQIRNAATLGELRSITHRLNLANFPVPPTTADIAAYWDVDLRLMEAILKRSRTLKKSSCGTRTSKPLSTFMGTW
jgi:hypothetical protein